MSTTSTYNTYVIHAPLSMILAFSVNVLFIFSTTPLCLGVNGVVFCFVDYTMLFIEMVEHLTTQFSTIINSYHLDLSVNMIFYKRFELLKFLKDLRFLPHKIQPCQFRETSRKEMQYHDPPSDGIGIGPNTSLCISLVFP